MNETSAASEDPRFGRERPLRIVAVTGGRGRDRDRATHAQVILDAAVRGGPLERYVLGFPDGVRPRA